jgi:hypothetical protein
MKCSANGAKDWENLKALSAQSVAAAAEAGGLKSLMHPRSPILRSRVAIKLWQLPWKLLNAALELRGRRHVFMKGCDEDHK